MLIARAAVFVWTLLRPLKSLSPPPASLPGALFAPPLQSGMRSRQKRLPSLLFSLFARNYPIRILKKGRSKKGREGEEMTREVCFSLFLKKLQQQREREREREGGDLNLVSRTLSLPFFSLEVPFLEWLWSTPHIARKSPASSSNSQETWIN